LNAGVVLRNVGDNDMVAGIPARTLRSGIIGH
jgi:serine acetyltransferase